MDSIPADVSLKLRRVTLLDLFLPEKIAQLRNSLENLFPEFRDPGAPFQQSFREIVEGLSNGGWMQAGSIDRKVRFPLPQIGGRFARVGELPDGVKRINFSVAKVLPSIALLQVDIFTDETITDELMQRSRIPLLPDFEITKFGFFKFKVLGWQETPRSARTEIDKWSEALRAEIELRFGLGRTGEFGYRNRNGRLPAIEAYALSDNRPLGGLTDWSDNNATWMHALGFESTGFSQYASENCLACWSTDRPGSGTAAPFRLIAFQELCGAQLSDAIDQAVDSVAPPLALLGWIAGVIEQLEQLRAEMFSMLTRKRTRRGLSDYISVNQSIQSQAMALERVRDEAQQGISPILLDLGSTKFNLISKIAGKSTPRDLFGAMKNVFDYRVTMLSDESSRMTRTFSDFLSARNMKASYELQRVVLLFTAVAIVVNVPAFVSGIISLKENWPAIERWVLHWFT